MTLTEYILSKKSKYKGVLIDTNLLLLLFIGLFDKKQIESYKRVNKYSREDFDKLNGLINYFSNKIFITSNILTEICNLTDDFNKKNNQRFFQFVEAMLEHLKEYSEKSADLIKNNQRCFYKFGIADTSIVNLAKQNTLIITDDLKLYHFLITQNLDAINYNHLNSL